MISISKARVVRNSQLEAGSRFKSEREFGVAKQTHM